MLEKEHKHPFFSSLEKVLVVLAGLLGAVAGYVYGHQTGNGFVVVFAFAGFVIVAILMGGFVKFVGRRS